MADFALNFLLGVGCSYGLSVQSKEPIAGIFSSLSLLFFLVLYTQEKTGISSEKLTITNPGEMIVGLLAFLIEYVFVSGIFTVLRYWIVMRIGGLILVVGLVVSTFSYYYLLEQLMCGRRLVDHGPFAYVRHPYYLGLIVYLAGCCIYSGCYISLASLFFYYTTYARERIVAEEISLCEEFEEYRAYQMGVKDCLLLPKAHRVN
jgi:protein-S-isoprenylcysteine O-methyltransferase Ste14